LEVKGDLGGVCVVWNKACCVVLLDPLWFAPCFPVAAFFYRFFVGCFPLFDGSVVDVRRVRGGVVIKRLENKSG